MRYWLGLLALCIAVSAQPGHSPRSKSSSRLWQTRDTVTTRSHKQPPEQNPKDTLSPPDTCQKCPAAPFLQLKRALDSLGSRRRKDRHARLGEEELPESSDELTGRAKGVYLIGRNAIIKNNRRGLLAFADSLGNLAGTDNPDVKAAFKSLRQAVRAYLGPPWWLYALLIAVGASLQFVIWLLFELDVLPWWAPLPTPAAALVCLARLGLLTGRALPLWAYLLIGVVGTAVLLSIIWVLRALRRAPPDPFQLLIDLLEGKEEARRKRFQTATGNAQLDRLLQDLHETLLNRGITPRDDQLATLEKVTQELEKLSDLPDVLREGCGSLVGRIGERLAKWREGRPAGKEEEKAEVETKLAFPTAKPGIPPPFDKLILYLEDLEHGRPIRDIPVPSTGGEVERKAYQQLREAILKVSQSEWRVEEFLFPVDYAAVTRTERLRGAAAEAYTWIKRKITEINDTRPAKGAAEAPAEPKKKVPSLEELAQELAELHEKLDDLAESLRKTGLLKIDKETRQVETIRAFPDDLKLNIVEHYNVAKLSDDPERQRFFKEHRPPATRVRAAGPGAMHGISTSPNEAETVFEPNPQGQLLVVKHPSGWWVFPEFEGDVLNYEAQAAFERPGEDLRKWNFRRWVVLMPASCDQRNDGRWVRTARGELGVPETLVRPTAGADAGEIRTLAESVAKLQTELANALAELRSAPRRDKEFKNLRFTVGELSSRVIAFEAEVKELEEKLATTVEETKAAAAKSAEGAVSKAVEEVTKRFDQSAEETARAAVQAASKDWQSQLTEVQGTLNTMQESIKSLREDATKLRTEFTSFAVKMNDVEAVVASAERTPARAEARREKTPPVQPLPRPELQQAAAGRQEEPWKSEDSRHRAYYNWFRDVVKGEKQELTCEHKRVSLDTKSPVFRADQSGNFILLELREGPHAGPYVYPDPEPLRYIANIEDCFELPNGMKWKPAELLIERPAAVTQEGNSWTLLEKGKFVRKQA